MAAFHPRPGLYRCIAICLTVLPDVFQVHIGFFRRSFTKYAGAQRLYQISDSALHHLVYQMKKLDFVPKDSPRFLSKVYAFECRRKRQDEPLKVLAAIISGPLFTIPGEHWKSSQKIVVDNKVRGCKVPPGTIGPQTFDTTIILREPEDMIGDLRRMR